ncbi:uncharacterized protein [Ptychodera flava]|uniref:uncharacterized protein n=1 Tax=Ptychodera flava TaxID=63121 RepID=UPI00396A09C1
MASNGDTSKSDGLIDIKVVHNEKTYTIRSDRKTAEKLKNDSKYLLEIIKKAEETERTKCTATSATTQPTNVSSKIMTDKSSPHQAEETQICGDQLQVPGTETPTKWPKGASTTLVQLRLNKDEEFHKHKVHKQLWNEINNEMKDRGYTFTADQCLNKWKSLKREYKSTVDHNSHTGNNKKTCLFYEEFNRLYGNKQVHAQIIPLSHHLKLVKVTVLLLWWITLTMPHPQNQEAEASVQM